MDRAVTKRRSSIDSDNTQGIEGEIAARRARELLSLGWRGGCSDRRSVGLMQ